MVDEFQPHFRAAVCAEEDGAFGNGFAGGGDIFYLLDYEAIVMFIQKVSAKARWKAPEATW